MSRTKRKVHKDSFLMYLDVFIEVLLYAPKLLGKMVKWIVEAV